MSGPAASERPPVGIDRDPRALAEADAHPYPLLFLTVSGAHLYGFASPDSDADLRGAHVVPARKVLGLHPTEETVSRTHLREGLEIDIVTHDTAKFFRLLLKPNGYALEQILSPLVVRTTRWHEEAKGIARACITRRHADHYLGFAARQWRNFEQERRLKSLLYIYRILLTGIHLARTAQLEANLVRLNEEFRLPQVADLVSRKARGPERAAISEEDIAFHAKEYARLRAALEVEATRSPLPERSAGAAALDELLVRIRISTLAAGDDPPPSLRRVPDGAS